MYCQVPGTGRIYEDEWNGIERVNIPIESEGWLGTSRFDLVSIRHACRFQDVCLTFGYNTAIFNLLQRIKGIPNIINMDGIEWSRSRWGKFRQLILYLNERIACVIGDCLIADHPEIEAYLLGKASREKLVTITYGADAVYSANESFCTDHGLQPGRFLTLIARPIPENSILEIVRGFSIRERGYKLVILGRYLPESDSYHREVMTAASDEVIFLGPIYEPDVVQALRYHSIGYAHGHTVGGTNPSLVEAMAAGNPVIAHDNVYNRWVAGSAALYFDGPDSVDERISRLLKNDDLRDDMSQAARKRHSAEFTWEIIGKQYEEVLNKYV
ncbi:UNVERIFIED_CONTAM: uncharacterized protein DUF1972 [Williamsia faeni]